MKQLTRLATAFLAIAVFAVTGCSSEGEDNQGTPDAGGAATGTYNHFVNSSLKIGTNANEATALAFADLDGAGSAKDNALGIFLANLNAQLMLDMALATAVNDGSIVILHSVRADDITSDSTASWQVWLGDAQAMPKFDGTGQFTVASNAPRDAIVQGSIAAGKFTGQASQISLELSLVEGSAPLRVKLNAVHLEASVTTSTITSGRLAGAISTQELNDNVVPALAGLLDARIGADAGCRTDEDMCEAGNKIIRQYFDISPKDGTISVAEVRDNPLLLTVFTPDVDVLLANGQAGHDSINESVSIALGFSGVKGSFTAPTE